MTPSWGWLKAPFNLRGSLGRSHLRTRVLGLDPQSNDPQLLTTSYKILAGQRQWLLTQGHVLVFPNKGQRSIVRFTCRELT